MSEKKEAKVYVAKAPGFDGIKVREIGEKFEFAGKPGSWMALATEDEAKSKSESKPSKSGLKESVI